VIFILGSLLAANAGSTDLIITGRAIMGLGAALAVPASLSMLVDVFHTPSARVTAIAGWTASAGVDVAIGPLVGGFLLDHFWWGSIFSFNAAVAAGSLVISLRLLPRSQRSEDRHFDVIGVVLSVVALTGVVGAIIEAPTWGWTSFRFIGLMLVALVAFVATWLHARRDIHGIIDWKLLRNRRFTLSSIGMGAVYFGIFGYLFMLTQYLQEFLGESPFSAGIHFLPAAIAVVAGSGVTRALQTKLSTRVFVTFGLLLLGIALVKASLLGIRSGYANPLITLILGGAGMGFVLTSGTDAVMETLPEAETGTGAAINVATMEIGGALGVAIFGTLPNDHYRHSISSHLTGALPHALIDIASRSLAGGLGIAHSAPHDVLTVVQEAFIGGFQRASVAGVVVSVIIMVLLAFTLTRPTPERAVIDLRNGATSERSELTGASEPHRGDDRGTEPLAFEGATHESATVDESDRTHEHDDEQDF
jgi:predicted MFS family arabinose efflux permease